VGGVGGGGGGVLYWGGGAEGEHEGNISDGLINMWVNKENDRDRGNPEVKFRALDVSII